MMFYYKETASSHCSAQCHCTPNIVNCSHLNLSSFPANLPIVSKEIDLSFNLLTTFPSRAFVDQAMVSELFLNNNRIAQINEKLFEGLNNLQVLNLCSNRLVSITNNKTFCYLPKLKELYLCLNSLVSVPDLCLFNVLSILDLSANILNKHMKFPFSYHNSKQLTQLKLSMNYLNNITVSTIEFLPVDKLLLFECVNCGLSYLPLTLFHSFSGLRFLNLSFNPFDIDGFSSLVTSIGNLSCLTVVNFSSIITSYSLSADFFKPIANIPLQQLILTKSITYIKSDTFSSLHLLQHLDLSFSVIRGFDKYAFRGLSQLKYLLVSDCQLIQPPLNIPTSIIYLNFHYNYFRSIENFGLDKLSNLEEIDLSNNLLSKISFHVFQEMHRIQTINLDGNSISFATSDGYFFEMYNITTLSFDNNRLVRIDFTTDLSPFTCMRNLKTLSIRNNECKYLATSTFNHLQNLQRLYLDFNRLQDSINGENLFVKLKMLREISLTENEIRYLNPTIFSNQANLMLLDLRNNFISSWDPTLFMPLISLRFLLLSNNRLSLINESSVKYWPKQMTFDLSENPFNCWCDLTWFMKWFQASAAVNSTNSKKYVCSTPRDNENRLISSINTDDISNRCLLLPWKIIVISVAAGASLLVGVLLGIIYRYQWNIKLFWYTCRHRNEIDNNLEDSDAYNIFISHEINNIYDKEWARELANYIEEQPIGIGLENRAALRNEEGNNVIEGIMPLLSVDETTPLLSGNSQLSTASVEVFSTDKRWKVYCYERSLAGEDYFENFSKAIRTVRYVIVGLSTDYLKDRQCQFELDQLKFEMIRRYGRQMRHRIIMTTLNNNGELLHKLPKDLNFYNNSQKEPLNWVSTDEANHELFKIQIFEQLIQVSRTMREY